MLILALACGVSYSKSGIIRASAPVVFRVISQTQKYPSFIPFVSAAKIIKHISPSENITQLTVSYNNFKDLSYASHVKMHDANIHLQDPKAQIPNPKSWVHSVCQDEPLKKLDSYWEIESKDWCTSYVTYKLNFQFSSPLYQLASSVLKDYMGIQMWDLFEKKALAEQTKEDRAHKEKMMQNQMKERQENQKQRTKNKQQKGNDDFMNGQPTKSELQSFSGECVSKSEERKADGKQQKQRGVQQCKILKLSQFLSQHPQLKQIYEQNTSVRKKIEQMHVRLEPMPDYETEMERQIKKIAVDLSARVENGKV